MTEITPGTVLLIGATGSVGRLLPAVAAQHGLRVRGLVRDLDRAQQILPDTELVQADLEEVASLAEAVSGVDAIIFAQGASAGGSPERVDYGGIRNVLSALGELRPRLVVMTALYVTRHDHFLNEDFDGVLDWRRRAERLVRASGLPYTIVRPSWFDRVEPGDHSLVFEQGDTGEGGVARAQIAEILVRSLITDAALNKTFELFAARGTAPSDWTAKFRALLPDTGIDGALDSATMPVDEEPEAVRADLQQVGAQANRVASSAGASRGPRRTRR